MKTKNLTPEKVANVLNMLNVVMKNMSGNSIEEEKRVAKMFKMSPELVSEINSLREDGMSPDVIADRLNTGYVYQTPSGKFNKMRLTHTPPPIDCGELLDDEAPLKRRKITLP